MAIADNAILRHLAWSVASRKNSFMANPSRRPDPALVAALVAIACIGNLVALTVLGILTKLPVWASVLIVVTELLAPLLVFQLLKRAQRPK
jgi:hypothetical protein